MVARRRPLLALAGAASLASPALPPAASLVVGSLPPAASFAPSSRAALHRGNRLAAASSLTARRPTSSADPASALRMGQFQSDENFSTTKDATRKRNADTYGIQNGGYLLLFALAVNVWFFTIPVEFRRSKFCSEEDVRLHPESKCTTFDAWRRGIAEYYANGGGVEFDFSIEGRD